MSDNLPIMYQRDLVRLLALPASQLRTAAHLGMPIYGFLVLAYRCDPDGAFNPIILCRSGIAVEVDKNGRIKPARKVG